MKTTTITGTLVEVRRKEPPLPDFCVIAVRHINGTLHGEYLHNREVVIVSADEWAKREEAVKELCDALEWFKLNSKPPTAVDRFTEYRLAEFNSVIEDTNRLLAKHSPEGRT